MEGYFHWVTDLGPLSYYISVSFSVVVGSPGIWPGREISGGVPHLHCSRVIESAEREMGQRGNIARLLFGPRSGVLGKILTQNSTASSHRTE